MKVAKLIVGKFIMHKIAAQRACTKWLALALLAAAPSAWAGSTLDRIKQSGKIVIAHRESSVPFSYVLPDKKPVGYAVDVCLKIAEAVRKAADMKTITPVFLQVTPANRIAVVAEGKADIECGSTTNNAERRQKVAFTVPHYIAGARYLVRADSPIDALQGFEHKKLVSTKGTTPLKAIDQANRERLLGITILEAPDPSKLKVVGKFLTIEPYAMILPKDDPEFKKIVDDEMKRLIKTHEIHALYERWFMKPIPPKNTALNMPMNYLLKDFWKYPTDQVPN